MMRPLVTIALSGTKKTLFVGTMIFPMLVLVVYSAPLPNVPHFYTLSIWFSFFFLISAKLLHCLFDTTEWNWPISNLTNLQIYDLKWMCTFTFLPIKVSLKSQVSTSITSSKFTRKPRDFAPRNPQQLAAPQRQRTLAPPYHSKL